MAKLNSDILAGFVNGILAKNYDKPTPVPYFHKEWWDLVCSDAANVAIAAPRQHAKSTAITHAYTLASVLFREHRHVLIVSDTESQSSAFLGQIKTELQENENLKDLFEIEKFVKDSETEIIVEFKDGEQFRILAKGAGQALRGTTWRNCRPDLILCDDMENEELVMNKDRREKFRFWFLNALLQCRSVDGKVRLVGTVLHMDSLLERMLPKPWVKSTIKTPVKTLFGRGGKGPGGWLAVRYRAHSDDFRDILWSDRYNRQWLENVRDGYIGQGYPEGYSQEYLNIPLDETASYFKRSDFHHMTEEDFLKPMRYYAACDLAISDAERADYSVFVIVGIDESGTMHVQHMVRGRFDSHEIISTILALHRQYNPELFGIEQGAIKHAIGPFLNDTMRKTGVYPNMLPLVPTKDKQTRARSIQARLRAGGVKFNKDTEWYPVMEDELARFPRDLHDDCVDALAWIGLMLDKFVEADSREEMDLQEWEDEMEESGLDAFSNSGRNYITGY